MKFLLLILGFIMSEEITKYDSVLTLKLEEHALMPSILLINDDGSIDKDFSIAKWTEDELVEFFRTYLVQQPTTPISSSSPHV
jgi:hypothetical protein